MGRSPPPNNFRAPAASASASDPDVPRGARSPATRACAAGTWNSGTPDEPSAPSPASEGLSYARQSPPPSQGSPFTRELEPSADAAAAGQQGSPKRREPSPYGSPLGKMPSEPGALGARGAGTYKDAFASRDGGGRDYGYGYGGYGGDARRRDAPYGARGASAAGYHPPSAAESQVASQLLSSFARAALESGLEALTPSPNPNPNPNPGPNSNPSPHPTPSPSPSPSPSRNPNQLEAGRREGSRGAGGWGGGDRGGGMGGGVGGGMGGGGVQGGYRPQQPAGWVSELARARVRVRARTLTLILTLTLTLTLSLTLTLTLTLTLSLTPTLALTRCASGCWASAAMAQQPAQPAQSHTARRNAVRPLVITPHLALPHGTPNPGPIPTPSPSPSSEP